MRVNCQTRRDLREPPAFRIACASALAAWACLRRSAKCSCRPGTTCQALGGAPGLPSSATSQSMPQKRPTQSLIFCSGSPLRLRTPAVKSDGRRRDLSEARRKSAIDLSLSRSWPPFTTTSYSPSCVAAKTQTAIFSPLQRFRAKWPNRQRRPLKGNHLAAVRRVGEGVRLHWR